MIFGISAWLCLEEKTCVVKLFYMTEHELHYEPF